MSNLTFMAVLLLTSAGGMLVFRVARDFYLHDKIEQRLIKLCKGPSGSDEAENQFERLALKIAHSLLPFLSPPEDRSRRGERVDEKGYYIQVMTRIGVAFVMSLACFWLLQRSDALIAWKVTFPIVAFAIGYSTSVRILRLFTSSHGAQITRELNFGLDLFVLMLESGMSVDQSLRYFATSTKKSAPKLSEYQETLVAEIDAGTPYEKALAAWAERLGLDHGHEIADLFVQALLHGTELAAQLKRLSADIAENRLLQARATVGRKAAQLTVVMVFFFIPALLAIVAGPAVTSLMDGLQRM